MSTTGHDIEKFRKIISKYTGDIIKYHVDRDIDDIEFLDRRVYMPTPHERTTIELFFYDNDELSKFITEMYEFQLFHNKLKKVINKNPSLKEHYEQLLVMIELHGEDQ